MVRRIGETASDYAKRLEEPQREGESDEKYRMRLRLTTDRIEAIHGEDNAKFMTGPDGNPVLQDPYLEGKKIIHGKEEKD